MRLPTQLFVGLSVVVAVAFGALPNPNFNLLKETLDVAKELQAVPNVEVPLMRELDVMPNFNVKSSVLSRRLEPQISQKLPRGQTLTSLASRAQSKLQAEDAVVRLGGLDEKAAGFGPHLLTDPAAIELSGFADVMENIAVSTVERLGTATKTQKFRALSSISASSLDNARSGLSVQQRFCPFKRIPTCNFASKYRTADGSCNNKKNPLWGKAFTSFERLLPPLYDDDLRTPRKRAEDGSLLPNPRKLSFRIHDSLPVKDSILSHFAMEFGQFVSHDIQMNALSKGYLGRNLDCCGKHRNTRNCMPIDIPADDPYFRNHGTTCINFVRALPAPSLDCKLGVRQQMNQVTHFLDGSAIYGSSQSRQNDLRTKTGGKLKTTGQSGARDLMPQDSSAVCRTSAKCFKAGDVRVNQQPLLMSLHTIWVREHNRVAKQLSTLNPSWNDEKIFQEARKITTAEMQHVTYKEYLPLIIGTDLMNRFDLNPKPANQYYTGYDEQVKPQIRNAFAAAAYRFGHSMIRDNIKSSKPGSSSVHTLKDVMLKADLVYGKGVSEIVKGMYEQPNYKTDRFMSHEVTRHLFQTAHGNGIDLAAANINRGRDHGTADYNTWRMACGLSIADDFNQLSDHDASVRNLLRSEYGSVNDLDLFTGGVSENTLTNAAIGPTFACIVGLQFLISKKGDRFFYESNTDVKFSSAQLNEIKKTSMAKIICDNTDLNEVPPNVFKKLSGSNNNQACSTYATPSFTPWRDCVDGGWSNWSAWKTTGRGCRKIRTRTRKCNNPAPSACGRGCSGRSMERRILGGSIMDLTSGCVDGPILRPIDMLPPDIIPPFRRPDLLRGLPFEAQL